MNQKTLVGASVASAAVASLCCIGPVLAVGLGLGAAGAVTALEPLRPYLLTAAAAFLLLAFYRTYRQQPGAGCEGGACATAAVPSRNRVLLWISVAAVAAFAAFPYYSSALRAGESGAGSAVSQRVAGLRRVVYDVKGMTCESCALGARATLSRRAGIVGIDVSYAEQSADVTFDPTLLSADELAAAFAELGYRAAPRGQN